MRKTALILLLGIVLLIGIIYADQGNGRTNGDEDEFCGSSTEGYCASNSDCGNGGCSGQICTNTENQNITTTCEWRDCYSNEAHNMQCGCVENKCKWYKNETEENETEEDGSKVCCMITRITTEATENRTKYHWAEQNDCTSKNQSINVRRSEKATKEIVNDSLCEDIKEAVREKNRLKFENRTGIECADNCTCTGVVMKCILEDGTREMTVYTRSGNIIFQVKGTNATTTVILYHHNGKTYGNFSDGVVEIKVLPDKVKEKINEKKKIKIEQENISLDEDGVYSVEAKKKARFFFIFPVRERFHAEVDSENGEILKFRNPWWGFLARDIKE